MSLKYALYPGCAAKGATPELYQSTMAIIGRLGIDVVELQAASCCGAGVISEADHDDLRDVPGRDGRGQQTAQRSGGTRAY